MSVGYIPHGLKFGFQIPANNEESVLNEKEGSSDDVI